MWRLSSIPSLTEREILLLILESANFKISPITRSNEYAEQYPFIQCNGEGNINASSIQDEDDYDPISYQEIVDECVKIIRENGNK